MYSTPNHTKKPIVSGKQTSIIRRFFFEKLGIQPNYNSRYEIACLFQLLCHMCALQLSAEEASQQLKITFPNALIASADTLLRRLKEIDSNLVGKAFDRTVKRMLKSFTKQNCKIAIDYHDIPYYGNKNNPCVRGTKKKAGTNWCHQYATLEIVNGEQRLTLAVKKLTVNDDEKARIIIELIQTAKKHAFIELALLDRAFCNIPCIRALKQERLHFIMACPKDKKIKKAIKENATKLPIIVPYTMGSEKNSETFKLALKYSEPKKDPRKPRDVHCFATNLENKTVEEITELYRKRWSIETGYKTKKCFRVKTSTQNNIIRRLYFYLECLFYNAWYSTRTLVPITIASFKKIIEQTTLAKFIQPLHQKPS